MIKRLLPLLLSLLVVGWGSLGIAEEVVTTSQVFQFSVQYNNPVRVNTKVYIDGKLADEFQEDLSNIMPARGGRFTLLLSEGIHTLRVIDPALGINWEGKIGLVSGESHCNVFIKPEAKTVNFGCQKDIIYFE